MTRTQISEITGVPEGTIARWLSGDINSVRANNADTPDLRLKIPPKEREAILKQAEAGETQAQIAAQYKTTQGRISQIVAAERKRQQNKRDRLRAAEKLPDDAAGVARTTVETWLGDTSSGGSANTCAPDLR